MSEEQVKEPRASYAVTMEKAVGDIPVAEMTASILNRLKAVHGARGPNVTADTLLGCRSFDRDMTPSEVSDHFRSKGKLPPKSEVSG